MADGTGNENRDPGNGIKSDTGSGNGNGIASIFGDGTPIIDPGESVGNNGNQDGNESGAGEGSGKRKRGRPKGSGSKKARTPHDIDISGVEKLLFTIHAGIASIFKVPELLLEPSEAQSMAVAIARVARHYPVLDKIGDKAIDHANLVVVLSSIYGSRLLAWNLRHSAEKAKPVDGQVVNFPNAGPQH